MSESNEMVIARELIMKARAAQEVYATFSQKQLDKMAKACAKTVYDNGIKGAQDTASSRALNRDSIEGGLYCGSIQPKQEISCPQNCIEFRRMWRLHDM